MNENNLEQRLRHEAPTVDTCPLPSAAELIGRHQRSRRRMLTVVGVVGVACLLFAVVGSLPRSAPFSDTRSQGLSTTEPTARPATVAAGVTNDIASLPSESVSLDGWSLRLYPAAASGLYALAAVPDSGDAEPTLLGHVIAPPAVEVPVWQLHPSEQEAIHRMWQDAKLTETFDL